MCILYTYIHNHNSLFDRYVHVRADFLCDHHVCARMCMYVDVSAKENAQETAVTLIGIVGGLAFAR